MTAADGQPDGPLVIHLATLNSSLSSPRTVCGATVENGDGDDLTRDRARLYTRDGCPQCRLGLAEPAVVAQRVDEIRRMRHADDEAHAAEDALHRDVLRGIADGTIRGSATVRAVCAQALATRSIAFSRWYA